MPAAPLPPQAERKPAPDPPDPDTLTEDESVYHPADDEDGLLPPAEAVDLPC